MTTLTLAVHYPTANMAAPWRVPNAQVTGAGTASG